MKDDLGISKLMKIALLNLNDMDFRSKESTEKSLVVVRVSTISSRSGTTPSYFPALMN